MGTSLIIDKLELRGRVRRNIVVRESEEDNTRFTFINQAVIVISILLFHDTGIPINDAILLPILLSFLSKRS